MPSPGHLGWWVTGSLSVALASSLATSLSHRVRVPEPDTAALARAQVIPVIPNPPPDQVALDAFRAHIQHIVFIVKENRSFDTYFGTFPGAEGATSGLISTGE